MNIFTLCTIFAGVLWGTISVFLKNLSSSGLSLIQITACRAIFSSFFLFVYFLVKDKNLLKIKVKDIWMFVGTGAFTPSIRITSVPAPRILAPILFK